MSNPGCRVVRAGISAEPISAQSLHDEVLSSASGAVVTFDGVVRDRDTPGRGAVTLLDYEAHPSAAAVVEQVAARVAAASSATAVAVLHRTGPLVVGDCALAVAVAAAHRGDAFATAAALVDAVKDELPVWKHQHFADGTDEWVGLGELSRR
jgi:molybdopterin synthase catalytic subunit